MADTVRFQHYDLHLIQPGFASPLTDVLIELEHLRRLQLRGDTPVPLFFQLKRIFHLMESLGSARIEGNHTTLADYIETKIDPAAAHGEDIREIENIEKAMDYVDGAVAPGEIITHQLIRELHSLTVGGLTREGDKTPGSYRRSPVQITGSRHVPPDPSAVQGCMDELVNFINRDDPPKYDLLKTALAHHRFSWIHPFANGNGRVVRLLTYTMLIKYGFNVKTGGRVLNPTAVFCNDRDRYYARLGEADQGSDEALEAWCTYVLTGIRDELVKVDKLTRYEYLKRKVLHPAIDYSRERGLITETEKGVLSLAVEKGEFKAQDVDDAMPGLSTRQRTYQIKKLVDARMIQPVKQNSRIYTIHFTNSVLIRGVMKALEAEGFTPALER